MTRRGQEEALSQCLADWCQAALSMDWIGYRERRLIWQVVLAAEEYREGRQRALELPESWVDRDVSCLRVAVEELAR